MAQHLEALKEYRWLRVELLHAIDGPRVADMAVGISDEPYAGPTDRQIAEQRRLEKAPAMPDALAETYWG